MNDNLIEKDTFDEQFDEAQKQAQNAAGTFTCKFKTPPEYNGEKYEELTFDFEKLTGDDALNIEAELAAHGKFVIAPAFDGEFLIRAAAKACTKPINASALRNISIMDFLKIRDRTRSFFLRSES